MNIPVKFGEFKCFLFRLHQDYLRSLIRKRRHGITESTVTKTYSNMKAGHLEASWVDDVMATSKGKHRLMMVEDGS